MSAPLKEILLIDPVDAVAWLMEHINRNERDDRHSPIIRLNFGSVQFNKPGKTMTVTPPVAEWTARHWQDFNAFFNNEVRPASDSNFNTTAARWSAYNDFIALKDGLRRDQA